MMLAAPPPRHTLAPMNFRNYQYLVQGEDIPGLEGLRGKELDYALVELEQKAVTAITEQYFKGKTDKERVEIMKNMNEAMMSDSWKGLAREGAVRALPGISVHSVARKLFPNGDYDFSNEEHRIALGKAMVDLRSQQNDEISR